jgi:CheY-like chemotaxis protein
MSDSKSGSTSDGTANALSDSAAGSASDRTVNAVPESSANAASDSAASSASDSTADALSDSAASAASDRTANATPESTANAATDSAGGAASDSTAEQITRVRILIVEDDSLQAEILAAALTAAGFEADTVAEGLGGVWKAREGRYDVVLMDYQLPEIDGYAAARLIGDFMSGHARPVLIALTATPDQLNARQSGTASAFDAVLPKSPDLSGLFATITQCLASAPERSARQDAVFALLLQSWAEYDAIPARPGAQGDDTGPARILVIDDDAAQRLLLRSVLERRGYVVDVASDGLEAVRKIREGCYDLALVDYNVPEMDGWATGMLVRDMIGEDLRPRMIGLTATADQLSSREGTARSVFDEIIPKSADLQGLLSSVDRHMRASPNPVTRRAAAYVAAAGVPVR